MFHVKNLHLGHVAKSFALADAPSKLGTAGFKRSREQRNGLSSKSSRPVKGKTSLGRGSSLDFTPKVKRKSVSEFDTGTSSSSKQSRLSL
mmetsp:Transcript_28395/g.46008  ORF Transcript_28395/g.46008 Transcript_28395/m.46008 type:complete len:90 (+) Transcript_28395:557-826(+)